MPDITPTYFEDIEIQALKTDLGGTEAVESTFDAKDLANGPYDSVDAIVGYAPGATPITGGALTIEVKPSADGGASPEKGGVLHSISPFADTTQTVVDADSASAQAVLNVTATTPFAVGDRVLIDHDNSGGGREWGQIASIQAGVSITLEDNLANTHTAAQADTVKVWQTKPIPLDLGGISHLTFRLINDDTDNTDDCIVQIHASARAGYTSA